MKIFHSSAQAKKKIKRPIIALGNFDGVHLAHQKMFQVTQALAGQLRGSATVYTFNPHPTKILSPQFAPPLINTLEQKIDLIREQKMKALILEPFTLDFSHLSAKDFLEKILLKRLQVVGIVAGYDFTFGAKRSGTIEMLQEFCDKNDITSQILKPQMLKKCLISSSRIRALIEEGKVWEASTLLGRPYTLTGKVIHGEKRGKSLGFPTANLAPENELLPATGVYATGLYFNKKTYKSVTNIGFRPTFDGRELSVEIHILNFKQSIYRRRVELRLIKRIREERKFSSLKDLTKQIKKDIKAAQKILMNKKLSKHS